MSEWLDYRPSDFLMFSKETYWRLFELQNQWVWPFQMVAVVAAIALILAILGHGRWAGLVVGLTLAGGWVFVGQGFLATRYEPINWAIGYVTPVFSVQAVLLAILAPRLTYGQGGVALGLAAGIAVLAIVYPAVGVASGRPLVQSEFVGVAPDPTVLLTLGLLAIARRDWRAIVLSILPALWLLLSAMTLLTLGAPEGWVILAALGAGLGALIMKPRPARETGPPQRP